MKHGVAALYWGMVAFTILVLVIAAVLDHRQKHSAVFQDSDYLVDADPPPPRPALSVALHLAAIKSVASTIARTHVAAYCRVHPLDIPLMLQAPELFFAHKHDAEQPHGSHVGDTIRRVKDTSGTPHDAKHHVLQSAFVKKIMVLAPTVHPVLSLFLVSVVATRKVRAILCIDTIWGAFMVSALFFAMTGDAMSVAAPEDCKKSDLPIVRGVAVAVVSFMLSSAFTLILGLLHQREIVYCATWSEEARAHKLRSWKLLDRILGCIGMVYWLFAAVVVGLFLAQVTDRDRHVYLASSATVVLKSWVVMPVVMCLIFALVSSCITFEKKWLEDAVPGVHESKVETGIDMDVGFGLSWVESSPGHEAAAPKPESKPEPEQEPMAEPDTTARGAPDACATARAPFVGDQAQTLLNVDATSALQADVVRADAAYLRAQQLQSAAISPQVQSVPATSHLDDGCGVCVDGDVCGPSVEAEPSCFGCWSPAEMPASPCGFSGEARASPFERAEAVQGGAGP